MGNLGSRRMCDHRFSVPRNLNPHLAAGEFTTGVNGTTVLQTQNQTLATPGKPEAACGRFQIRKCRQTCLRSSGDLHQTDRCGQGEVYCETRQTSTDQKASAECRHSEPSPLAQPQRTGSQMHTLPMAHSKLSFPNILPALSKT